MKKLVSIVSICALMVSIGAFSVFGSTTVNYVVSRTADTVNFDNGVFTYSITSLGPHLVNADVEYTQNNTYPTYTIYPTDSNGSHLTSISSTTTNSLGGSITLNSPTSTGSQSGRYTIANFTTTTNLWGFKAVPSGGSSTSTAHSYYVVQYDFLLEVRLTSTLDNVAIANTATFDVTPSFTFNNAPSCLGSTVELIESNGLFLRTIKSSGAFTFSSYDEHVNHGHFVFAPSERLEAVYKLSFYGMFIDSYDNSVPTASLTYNNAITGLTVADDTVPNPSMIYQLFNLNNTLNLTYQDLHTILESYNNNAQNAQSVTVSTQTNEQTLSNIHQNEDTWFSQNNQALTATGMEDFSYTPQVMSGLTVISDQFNQLWNAIGDWNFVYTFSMMIGLVVLILRHNPQRKKNSGGKSNATSS